MDPLARLDGYQRRRRWLGLPLAVVYKFFDDQGNYLAALITYYGFLSLFPLLLLSTTVLGYVLAGNGELQRAALHSALREFPVIGQQLTSDVHSVHGTVIGLIVGIAVSLYGSLGIAQVTQNAMNTVWAVPRNARPNPIRSRVRSLVVLAVMAVGVLLSSGLSGVTTGTHLGPATFDATLRAGAAVLNAALNAALFLLGFRLLTAPEVGIRCLWPGAALAALVWQGLQEGGAYLVRHELGGATSAYGAFGIVLGLIAWIHLGATVTVLSAELNVVRARRLWPRSLLTPFTDNVRLTPADERAYESYVNAARHKGFERVDVDFDRRERDVGQP